ncbi:MAG: type II toxin-antitoxin system VapC family toxin [Deltaproteobacteria bacterium]|nr:MAG: type II toxin-antitoxin system VapC family toxin [Deltaproteobacteria bacterium]TMA66579.1 MAG: type II toxin-antitoxin system VapC family toxin [Deltaproteobacteria bacterium]TMB41540.1 MAG: type II toxin-antitoxin system VapC family toxin [Deltaproteobacteria bacterium]
MTVYLDTSTVLRVVLGQADPLTIWGKWDAACASELLGVEARRVLDRLRLDGVLDDEQVGAFHAALAAIERTIDRIRLTRLVLGRAALPMATPVKTLDALHLASALLWRERRAAELSFATHDPQQARAARALGFDCIGV